MFRIAMGTCSHIQNVCLRKTKTIYIYMAVRHSRRGELVESPKQVCRTPMPNTYAEHLCRTARHNDHHLVRNPHQRGMPNKVCRTPMPTTYAEHLCRKVLDQDRR